MDNFRPKRIRYKNILFRSKLEAMWAMFFDCLKIKYEYEPRYEEIDFDLYYKPDFHLPVLGRWVEIKPYGLKQMTRKETAKIFGWSKEFSDLLVLVGNPSVPRKLSTKHFLAWYAELKDSIYISEVCWSICPKCGKIDLSSDFDVPDSCLGGCFSMDYEGSDLFGHIINDVKGHLNPKLVGAVRTVNKHFKTEEL